MRKIAIIGMGYVGTVTATCLAWLGHDVTGLEVDPQRVGQLQAGQVPFYEPGLAEMLTAVMRTERLRFTSDPRKALSEAEIVFLCVGTPPGVGGLPNLSQVEAAARSVATYLRDEVVLVNKSTVPVGAGNSEIASRALRPGRPVIVERGPVRPTSGYPWPGTIVMSAPHDMMKS